MLLHRVFKVKIDGFYKFWENANGELAGDLDMLSHVIECWSRFHVLNSLFLLPFIYLFSAHLQMSGARSNMLQDPTANCSVPVQRNHTKLLLQLTQRAAKEHRWKINSRD